MIPEADTTPASGIRLCLVLTDSFRKRNKPVTRYEYRIPASIFRPEPVRSGEPFSVGKTISDFKAAVQLKNVRYQPYLPCSVKQTPRL
jgi:hypothetical protein